MPDKERCDVVILTALPVEYSALRRNLQDVREILHPITGTLYERGRFTADGQTWQVVLVEIGMGNVAAAQEATQAVNFFETKLIFFVGVAGGLKGVKLGDVVAATKVYGYESGKASAVFEPRPELWHVAYPLEQRARAVARGGGWLRWLGERDTLPAPTAYVGPIASGEKVVVSKESETWKLLKATYGDAYAVAMEDFGFLRVTHTNKGVDALVIRGISDLIDNKAEADAANWQEIAARNASAFAFEVLAKLGGGRSEQEQGEPTQGSVVSSGTAQPVDNKNAFEVYYSYADEDVQFVKELEKHLIMLKRKGEITDWHGGKIAPSQDVQATQLQHLNSARIILLFVSPNFLASERTYDVEVVRAMERHEAGEAKVIPIIVRPCDWKDTPFGGLLALPRPWGDKAVSEYKDRDRIWVDIESDIKALVKTMKKGEK